MEPNRVVQLSKWYCLFLPLILAVLLDKKTHKKTWKGVLCCRSGHKIRPLEKLRRDRTPAKKRKVDEATPGGSGFQQSSGLDGSSGNQIDLSHTSDIK